MSKKDNLIILDFDHVVFNTTLYVVALQKVFREKFDIEPAEFMKQRNAVKYCCVVIDVDRFAHSFTGKDPQKLRQAFHGLVKEQAHEFVFLDVLSFIKRHKEKFDIFIETHGDEELQREKIKHSKIPGYVKYNISLDSKDKGVGAYIDKYKQIHFFDDKAENIDKVKLAHPSVNTYFVKRPEDSPYGAQLSTCDCADYTIKSLDFNLDVG